MQRVDPGDLDWIFPTEIQSKTLDNIERRPSGEPLHKQLQVPHECDSLKVVYELHWDSSFLMQELHKCRRHSRWFIPIIAEVEEISRHF